MYLSSNHVFQTITDPMFCPGYLEQWLDSTLHLVLFIYYILNPVSVAYTVYVLSERWLTHLSGGYSQPVPTSVGRTLQTIGKHTGFTNLPVN